MRKDIIRIGAIGAGDISQYHLDGLKSAGGCVVTAISGRNTERASTVAAKCGIAHVERDYRDLLARSDVDAVVITTPENTHEAIAVDSARAGKSILLQKPFATSLQACQRIIAAAQSAGVDLQVSFMHRHFEETRLAREVLRSGKLGSVHAARIRNATPGPQRAWYYDPESAGGGAVAALGVHGIDLVQHLLGPVAALTAQTATMLKSRLMPDGTLVSDIKLEDQAFATYRLASGALVSHEMSTCELHGTDRFRMEVYCEKGVIELRGTRGPFAMYAPEVTGKPEWVVPETPVKAFGSRHHEHWLDILRGKLPSDATAWDALAGMHVVDAIYAASKSGSTVNVPLVEGAAYAR